MERENNSEISKLKRAVQDVNLVAEQTRTQSADEQAVSLWPLILLIEDSYR